MPYDVVGPKSTCAPPTFASVVEKVTMPTVGIFALVDDVCVNVQEPALAPPPPVPSPQPTAIIGPRPPQRQPQRTSGAGRRGMGSPCSLKARAAAAPWPGAARSPAP